MLILDKETEADLLQLVRQSAIDYFVEQAELFTLADTLEQFDAAALYRAMKDRLPELRQAILQLLAAAMEAGDIGIQLSRRLPGDDPEEVPIPNKEGSFFMIESDVIAHFRHKRSEFVVELVSQAEPAPVRRAG
jgi:hypothetical protein